MRQRKHLDEINSVRLVRIVNSVRKSICDRCMCGMRMREADRGRAAPTSEGIEGYSIPSANTHGRDYVRTCASNEITFCRPSSNRPLIYVTHALCEHTNFDEPSACTIIFFIHAGACAFFKERRYINIEHTNLHMHAIHPELNLMQQLQISCAASSMRGSKANSTTFACQGKLIFTQDF